MNKETCDISGFTVPRGCQDCPRLRETIANFISYKEYVLNAGLEVMKGGDPRRCVVVIRDEDGIELRGTVEELRGRLSDEAIDRLLKEGVRDARQEIVEELNNLDEAQKGLQQNINEETKGCPGVFVMRATDARTLGVRVVHMMRTCGSFKTPDHGFERDILADIARQTSVG